MKHILIIALLTGMLISPPHTAAIVADHHAQTETDTQSEPLIVAYDPELVPLHMDDGENRGFSLELMDRISEAAGLDIVYEPMTKSEAIAKITDQEIDIILSIPFSEKHSTMMEFTDAVFSTSVGVLTRVDDEDIDVVTDLSESLVALQNETVEYEFLRNIRRIQFQVTSSQRRALDIFIEGRADAFAGNVVTANTLLEQYGLEDEYTFADSHLLHVDYSFAVQRENYSLLNQLNSEIRRMKASGAYSELYDQYFQDDDPFARWLLISVQVAAGLLIILLLLFLISVRWNRQLQTKVEKKTADLNELNHSLLQQIELKRNNNEFLNQILDSSPRGIVTLDKGGKITKFNPQATQVSGIAVPPVHTPYEEVNLVRELLKEKAERVLKGEKVRFLGEHMNWTRSDGHFFQLRYFVYPLYNYDQQINGLILTFEDVTEEFTLRKKLFEQEKNQALSRVVAGIAHEIRNPLSSIKTFVELIPTKMHNEKFQQQISTYVPKEIVRVSELIEGLINYARPRHQTIEVIHVKKLLHECFILFEPTAANKGFEFHFDVPEELFIEADPHQLKQIVINLIINSLDALEEKQAADPAEERNPLSLTLAARKNQHTISIEVTDNGIGMTGDERKKILEPFYTTKSKGTGLGLAIAGQMIEENDGELKITSRKNAGTKMTLIFKASGKE
ncbi:ATP-binding protein [Salipaludibacillus aurantiacus]|uniref:histidine kinase n=1 Tax=Salipaludibacillus aurantiacus TaxID=1601833 RepID=A0A1H9UAQ1_9BACI|nr:transporter substrate-binding domain-containing protein [Salipaludibacillus aurantiacus]SES06173.1 polar amino acid transport system substrate-binding protein [Salipaludibacillus aurantiacus]